MNHKVIILGMAGLDFRLISTLASAMPPAPLVVVDPMSAPAVTDAEIIARVDKERNEKGNCFKRLTLFKPLDAADSASFRSYEVPSRPFYHGVPRKKRGRR